MKVVPAAEFFEAIARRYDRVYALDASATRARMAAVLGALPPAPSRVLDLGVGTGRELGALQDAGYEVTGLDVSRAMLALCARRARPILLVQADLWGRLPFDDASFDAVIALHGTLAHPPERAAHSRLGGELGRVVRAAGVVVAEVPSSEWLGGIDVIEDGDARIRRVARDRCVHEDDVAGVAIEAIVPTEEEWKAAFGEGFEVAFEALGVSEILVVAHRKPGPARPLP